MYDAFISYSHAKDKPIAEALQAVLQKLGKPWYRRRALRVFRDDTSLSATPHLWPTIEKGLAASRYLVLLASEEAAASPWVSKEVEYWLAHKSADTLLIALTSGELRWEYNRNDFAWGEASPLPLILRSHFAAEPKWVDFRGYRDAPSAANRQNPEFVGLAANIAAAVHGLPMEDLLSEELAQQRRALRLAWSAAIVLLMLAGAAAWQWRLANVAEGNARHTLALSDQQKAVELFSRTGTTDAGMQKPARALAYLARAIRNDPMVPALGRRALHLIAMHPHLLPDDGADGKTATFIQPRSVRLDRFGNEGAAANIKSPDASWAFNFGVSSPLKVRASGGSDWIAVGEEGQRTPENYAAAFPEHSRYAAVAGGTWTEYGGYAEVKIVDGAGNVLGKHTFDGELIDALALSPNGRLLIVTLYSPPTGGGDGEAGKWRTVILDVFPAGTSQVELAELKVIPSVLKSVRFSADSRFAALDGDGLAVGPVLASEPLQQMPPMQSLYFTADGTRIVAYTEGPEAQGDRWTYFDATSGAKIPGEAVSALPADAVRSAGMKATQSSNAIVVTAGDKTVFTADSQGVLLAGVNAAGDRLIWIRDDGSVQTASMASGTLGGEWGAIGKLYGHPWHKWTDDFLTVIDGRAERWTVLYRKMDVSDAAWRKALGASAFDFSEGSTKTALHSSGRIAAIVMMGHSRCEVILIDPMTGASLSEPMVVNDQYANVLFSRDGKWLFVHASNSGTSVGPFEVREIAGGLPLTRPRILGGPFAERPDGKRVLDAGGDGETSLFDLLGGEAPVPLWLADLAEGVSGWRLDERSVPQVIPLQEQSGRIGRVRQAIAAADASSNPWTEFGRWYLSADSDPFISPYSTMRRSTLEARQQLKQEAAREARRMPDAAPTAPARTESANPEAEGKAGANEEGFLDQPEAAPPPLPPPPTASPPAISGPFSVQVGAFKDHGEAERRLALVAGKFSDLLRNRPPAIITSGERGSETHRARFTGYSEADARTACAAMKAGGIDCFVAAQN